MRDGTAQPIDELLDVQGRDVLDIGCGGGWLVRRLADAGARAVGLDPSEAALERARAEHPAGAAASYTRGEAEALGFADASFDAVIFFNSLHHVPVEAMDDALREAARVLRPDGVIYVQEPRPEGSAFELLRLLDDETEVRARAQEALARALERSLVRLAHRELVRPVRHRDFAALRAHIVAVEASRAAAFDAQEDALREAFDRIGSPAAAGGVEFEQPFSVDLLAHAGRRAGSPDAPVARS